MINLNLNDIETAYRDWCDSKITPNTISQVAFYAGYTAALEYVKTCIPKEQFADGSQNVYVECAVEGFNDAIQQLKHKLKLDT